jgi:hypothetical protein
MKDLELNNGTMLYPREVTQAGKTAHSRYCQRSPRRYDYNCERCLELLAGAKPRAGWQREYVRRKLAQVQRRLF